MDNESSVVDKTILIDDDDNENLLLRPPTALKLGRCEKRLLFVVLFALIAAIQ